LAGILPAPEGKALAIFIPVFFSADLRSQKEFLAYKIRGINGDLFMVLRYRLKLARTISVHNTLLCTN